MVLAQVTGEVSAEALAERFGAQQLSGPPARSAGSAVGRLLAVQAQDPRGARLAIRARTSGLTAADVDRALTGERSLVVSWLNRGTLHLVRSEDYWWLQQVTAPLLFAGNARRLGQEGVSPADADRGVEAVERALNQDGPLTRAGLRDRIRAAGVRTEGQALAHIVMLACLRGVAVRGPMAGGEQAYVLVRDWLGAPPPGRPDRDAALAILARRYLAGHGPATDRDLAKWAGLPLRDARRGLAAISTELTIRPDGLTGLSSGGAESGPGAGAGFPPPRLLGPFDPVLHGWVSREPILGPAQPVITVNGLFRPFALVGGRAAATWRLTAGQVELAPFATLAPADAAALDADAADVRRFLAGDHLTGDHLTGERLAAD